MVSFDRIPGAPMSLAERLRSPLDQVAYAEQQLADAYQCRPRTSAGPVYREWQKWIDDLLDNLTAAKRRSTGAESADP
jgi:hypothetical protein